MEKSQTLQSSVLLPPTPDVVTTCSGCRLILELVVVLRSPPDSTGGPTIGSQLNLGADGRFYLTPTAEPGMVEVYDSTGQRILRFGGFGDGPGELRGIRAAVGIANGEILVVDGSRQQPLQRYTSNGEFLGAGGTPLGIRRLHWSDVGVILVTQKIANDRLIPVHLLDNGELKPLGAIPAENPRTAWLWGDTEAAEIENVIWIARADRFSLQAVSPEGVRVREFNRDEPHFAREVPSRIIGVTSLAEGVVLVTSVQNADYRNPENWDPSRPLSTELLDDKLDARIDVVDPNTGEYIVSGVFELPIAAVAGRGLVYMPREDEDASMSVYVWRISLSKH